MENKLDNCILNNQNKESKSAWHCPMLSRIEIKKTMSGSLGSNDLSNGVIPS